MNEPPFAKQKRPHTFSRLAHTFQGRNSSTLHKRPFKGASESTHCIIENSYALPWGSGEKMADTFKVMGAGNVSYSFLTHAGGDYLGVFYQPWRGPSDAFVSLYIQQGEGTVSSLFP